MSELAAPTDPPPRELIGRVAVVTGAARAIGREIAETLAARGATIVSLDLAAADATIEAVEGRGATALALTVDVADAEAVESAFAKVLEAFGRVDLLVNNAGLYATLERRAFWEIPVDEWDRLMAVNVRSVFLCARSAAAAMREARQGRIINLASGVVSFGMANLMHYVASKAAVIGMTRSMARELGAYGISVNAVAPGLVTTEITKETVPEKYRRQVAEGQCLQEPILPADIAHTVAFLCSPAARMITGQTVLVNGGATMGPA
ncbi:MAG TPA: 3-oxoacyl-ACP reductase family protein [Gaiellaceae bacterium]|nr:3-oxoacyl-ACP reductase family protein [Gaiellaceae bacterium]